MFWAFKLSFVVDILAYFALETVWATFEKLGDFSNLHDTLQDSLLMLCLTSSHSCLDSLVSRDWLDQQIKPLSACPWKKSHCVLAAKSIWKLTTIVGDLQGSLGKHLRPHPIHFLKINVIILITYKILLLNLQPFPSRIVMKVTRVEIIIVKFQLFNTTQWNNTL